LWDPPQFLKGPKTSIFGKNLTKFEIGGFIPQLGKYGKSKTVLFVIEYLTIFTPNLVGVG